MEIIEKYIELKKKNLSPTITYEASIPLPFGNSEGFLLSWTRYDEDTGQPVYARKISISTTDFVAQAKRLQKLWLQAKNAYETLTGKTFPTDD